MLKKISSVVVALSLFSNVSIGANINLARECISLQKTLKSIENVQKDIECEMKVSLSSTYMGEAASYLMEDKVSGAIDYLEAPTRHLSYAEIYGCIRANQIHAENEKIKSIIGRLG